MNPRIYNLDLIYNDTLVPFAIKTMEEINLALGGIADDPHRHNYYTVIWSLGATGTHIIDFKEYPIEPNHLFFVSPRQVHQMITNPSPVGIVILFTPEFLQKNSIREDFISNLRIFRDSDETPPLSVSDPMGANLTLFANAMMTAFHSEAEMRFETIGAYLKLFLIECNSHCSLHAIDSIQNMEVGRSLVRNFKDLVESRFREWHQVKEYADALNVSPGYLNEVIKSSIGKPAKDYIQNRLILETKRMVVFTPKSIKEIGFDLGFDDPSHFSKFFKTYTGVSVLEFRDSMGKREK